MKNKIDTKKTILEIKKMTKIFGPVTALKNVDFALKEGDVLGLIGENGSGKSTISSIFSGMQKATSCEKMTYKGKDWNPSSMLDALDYEGNGGGIGMIVQESGTIPGISVMENIFLGNLDEFKCFKLKNGKRFGPINKKKMAQAAKDALENIGIKSINPFALVSSLDFQARKLVEIAKVMLKDPDVLVIDETSTALAHDGRQILYGIINKFRGTKKAVVFISHDLDEIMEVCDSLTVLRDGEIIRSFKKEEFDPNSIRKAMIGRDLEGSYYRNDFDPTCSEEILLKCKNLNFNDRVKDVNLQLHKGEILGIGGLAHSGMHSLGKILFGAISKNSGEVVIYENNKTISIKNEAIAMKHKVGYVSKDRDIESLDLPASIKDNIAIAGMEKYAVGKFLIFDKKERNYVDDQINSLSIKCFNRNQLVQQLSGGNKQKVVFGKWIGRGSEILILDCPTRGVDIGVKQAMYQLMMKLKKEGKAILLISEEMPELIGMSDRILIMKDGEIKKEFLRSKDLSEADIIDYMI